MKSIGSGHEYGGGRAGRDGEGSGKASSGGSGGSGGGNGGEGRNGSSGNWAAVGIVFGVLGAAVRIHPLVWPCVLLWSGYSCWLHLPPKFKLLFGAYGRAQLVMHCLQKQSCAAQALSGPRKKKCAKCGTALVELPEAKVDKYATDPCSAIEKVHLGLNAVPCCGHVHRKTAYLSCKASEAASLLRSEPTLVQEGCAPRGAFATALRWYVSACLSPSALES